MCQGGFLPCPPSLLRFSFLIKSKLAAREQGRCAEKASAGKEIPPEIPRCLRRMGRAHRAPSRAPLHRNTPVLRERTACPPCTILGTGPARSKKGGLPHDFCAQSRQRRDFRAGQCLKFNLSHAYWRKVKGGKRFLHNI